MDIGLTQVSEIDLILSIERQYSALMARASATSETGEPGLGGQLLYAGELDSEGRVLVVAANIAGAATICVSADPTVQKGGIRDGIVDFVVTTLDEALRILKNEIRKRQPVAVCVAQERTGVEREMLERGVQPDLSRPRSDAPPTDRLSILSWGVEASPAVWMPKLDAIAAASLAIDEAAARRWLRLAGRYLGRMARGVRVVRCRPESAREASDRIRAAVENGEVGTVVSVAIDVPGEGRTAWTCTRPGEKRS